jgi:geranylgeranyl diphosphate synthase, type II
MNMASESPTAPDIHSLLDPTRHVEAYMEAYLQQRPLPANLREAICYSLLGPGKRLRPALVIHSAQTVGGSLDAALPAAAAIEMIHCFSLVHDDLPAMDNDDLRRGRPTLHRHTSEAMAILAGDAMMGLAFELLAGRVRPAERAVALIAELTAGADDMIAGQVYDTLPQFDAGLTPAQRLETIHRNKTGALIRAALRMGAISSGAAAEQLAALSRYGEAIGLMFQIVDDLLDITQTTEQLGKTAGKDVAQEKLTYPAVHGLDNSRRLVAELREQACQELVAFGPAGQPLRDLCHYLAMRTK